MASDQCTKHPFDRADGTCRQCRRRYCVDCLVWSFGADEAPFCLPCAVAAGGVRSNAANRRDGGRRRLLRR